MNIAIAGYGIEGKTSYKYWNTGGNDLTIVDERDSVNNLPDGAKTILGETAFAQLSEFDLTIRSPGIHPKKLPYGDKVWSATNEFFAKCPTEHTIGVTGTKGKGTTSSLITSILRAAGKTVHLVGNIGQPALETLPDMTPDDIVVFELSSFQLWDAQTSPRIAVVLPIEADHLDVHDTMNDYVMAKTNIVRYQHEDDITVFNSNNAISRSIGEGSAAQQVRYPFMIDEFVSSIRIPGQHNIENASAAIAAVQSYVDDPDVIKKGLASFEGLPHRLKFVAEKNGVKYYDDSIATTPSSAIAAIKSFDVPTTLILGGHDKGGDYTELMQACHTAHVHVLAIGANRERIAALCNQYDVEYNIEPGDMNAVVQRAAMDANEGSVVILSPAAASFDMFKNYAERGNSFIDAISQL